MPTLARCPARPVAFATSAVLLLLAGPAAAEPEDVASAPPTVLATPLYAAAWGPGRVRVGGVDVVRVDLPPLDLRSEVRCWVRLQTRSVELGLRF